MTPPQATPRIFERADRFWSRTAIVAQEGVFSYADLMSASARAATRLLGGRADLSNARICLFTPPGWHHVATQWGIWRAGGTAVPLATSHPDAELAYVLDDARPDVLVVHPRALQRLGPLAEERGIRFVSSADLVRPGTIGSLPEVSAQRPSMILYTSGSTGKPKGVVLTHANIEAQIRSLTEAWEWTREDHILLTLPLHHLHGIVNVLLSALWNGATCEMMPLFNPVDVWERLARLEIQLLMAVPTIYRRLIQAWDEADLGTRAAWTEGARACRLMVSGSAALPAATLERWEGITGHRLLERYGMTEIGMALSNPLKGERQPGHVGSPLPEVEVRLVDDTGHPVPPGTAGQVEVRGPTVFGEYWGRPQETAAVFTEDGWFRTGDVAMLENGSYRILGRASVDILKTGGEKISALEIEEVLRRHPAVSDCAVVGLPDSDWGDRVCAAVVRNPAAGSPTTAELREFVRARLAPYKVPKEIQVVDDLPRNAMGKVEKPVVRVFFELSEPS